MEVSKENVVDRTEIGGKSIKKWKKVVKQILLTV